jgi:hypothetical protein
VKIQRALAGAVLLCLASGGAAIAADNPNETRGSESKPCLVAGQDMGTITMSGVTEGWPPNHKPADLLFTIDENDDADPLDGVSISAAGSHTHRRRQRRRRRRCCWDRRRRAGHRERR